MAHSTRTTAHRAAAIALTVAATLAAVVLAAPAPTSPVSSGIDLAGMDRAVAPGDNFFAYANGTWLKTAAIPPDRSSYGPFDALEELTARRTADLIKEIAAKDEPQGPEARMIADFYTSYMDEAGIETRGLKPLQPQLDQIAAITSRAELSRYLGGRLRADVDVLNSTNLVTDNLFGLWVAQDLDNASRYLPFLLQGGLGLPDRSYYLDTAPEMAAIRDKYQAHIVKVLTLLRVTDAKAKAARIFALEARIAQAHSPRVDSGDVQKGNNHWTREDLDTKAPGLDWTAYLGAAGLGNQHDFVAWQPGAISGTSALVASEPIDAWKDYLLFHAVEHRAGVLPRAFLEERFAFYGKVLEGIPELAERWKRAGEATNEALGDAVGKLYVERYFPPAEKERAQAMVRNLLTAFGRRIDALEWMAPATKAQAKTKLAALKVGVGYPDRWTDYSGLVVRPDDAFGNAERAELFRLRRNLEKLGRPVDRGEWVMTPQTVNAVNLPAMNALNFPAAILQPPFFDPKRPLLMDYAAIGATIGHEISHSFDDQGALFDATGRLRNWWTKGDLDHFKAAAEKLVRQYDAYRPFPDLAINGRQTLGENIADVAGLAAAYDAYRISLGETKAEAVGGLDAEAQFFVSYGQSWRDKQREPALRRQVLTNGHAPAEYRADTVRNLDPWYAAFGVKPGQALYLAPADRVKIW
jgi:putative endopeptidase